MLGRSILGQSCINRWEFIKGIPSYMEDGQLK